jgi:hypothetical protein
LVADSGLASDAGIPFGKVADLCNQIADVLSPIQSSHNFKFFGSAAIACFSNDVPNIWLTRGRKKVFDIDIVGKVRDYNIAKKVLVSNGYQSEHPAALARRAIGGRLTVWHKEFPCHTLEIFADPMSWYADINLGSRLNKQGFFLNGHELAVTKLQCEDLTPSDLIDLEILFSDDSTWSDESFQDFARFSCSSWPLSWSITRNLGVLVQHVADASAQDRIYRAIEAVAKNVNSSVYFRLMNEVKRVFPLMPVGNEVRYV